MKPIKVLDDDLLKAINSGDSYIEVGDRKFLLFEVEYFAESEPYTVTDEAEKKQLLDALHLDNPILSEAEIDKMLNDSSNV